MLSGIGPILMRVRISVDALRLCALVAAGVTSGYLWRAAFESTSPQELRTSATPRVIEPAPEPPVVRIPPGHLTQPSRPAVTQRGVKGAAPRRQAETRLISAPVVSAPRSRPAPAVPKPAPSSNPPSPPPPTTTTTTPPPPPSTTTTPVVSPPTQAAATPPTTPAAPVTPPTSNGGNGDGNDDKGDSRPGWGNGDKNHDHSGPGGKNP
jgi:hypothetical protein